MSARTGNLVGAILLLVFFAWLGVRHALSATGTTLSAGQHAVIQLEWVYAGLAVLLIIGLVARRKATRLALYLWAVLFTARNALVPFYFGGKGVALALIGGVIGLAIAVGILYLAFRSLAPEATASPT